MSEEKLSGLTFAEKVFGLVLVLIGVLTSYTTLTNREAAGLGADLFTALGIIVTFIGLTLIFIKGK